MATIRIRGHTLDVDIISELERYSWTKPKWTNDKLLAASPFRYDNTPSFFVSLETGGWKDSGAYDADWESGNIVKLLSFFEDCTYEEVEERLLAEYGREWQYDEKIKIPKISVNKKENRHITSDILESYKYRHSYLEKRGISEKVQRLMAIGYSKDHRAVTIPWYSADGRLANVKYRQTRGKVFWYEKGAVPIRNLVYGMNVIYNKRIEEAVLCEAEIDAMTCYELGKAGIAVGGVSFTDRQADIIKRSPISRLIIATDNDKPGEKLKRQVIDKLRGCVELSEIVMPDGCKDVNEAYVKGMKSFNIKPIRQITI